MELDNTIIGVSVKPQTLRTFKVLIDKLLVVIREKGVDIERIYIYTSRASELNARSIVAYFNKLPEDLSGDSDDINSHLLAVVVHPYLMNGWFIAIKYK